MGAGQCLGSSRGHHSRQRPSRHWHGSLVSARCENQPGRREDHGTAADQAGDLVARERPPHRGVADQLDTGIANRLKQSATAAELPVVAAGFEVIGGRQRLEVLAAWAGTLVDDGHRKAGACGDQRGVQARRSGADDQNVDLARQGALTGFGR